MQRKDKRKNVPLKNGLQILSTLLISKKNILLTNIMKNITKKINLIQYLKNLNELINDYISPNSKKLYYLNRIQYHLQRIVNLIQKLDNSPFENIIITNEISELFEQYDFYNNIIVLLSCPEIQSTSIFYSLSIQIKNIISLICLNTGGINYLSKNG